MRESWFRRAGVAGLVACLVLTVPARAQDAAAPPDDAVYVTARAQVRDWPEFERYHQAFLRSVLAYGGEILLDRDTGLDELGRRRGDMLAGHIVDLKFSDLEAAHRWHTSPSYQQLLPLRARALAAFALTFSVERFDVTSGS